MIFRGSTRVQLRLKIINNSNHIHKLWYIVTGYRNIVRGKAFVLQIVRCRRVLIVLVFGFFFSFLKFDTVVKRVT